MTKKPVTDTPKGTPDKPSALVKTKAFFTRSGKTIVALTVKDILEEQIAHKLA